MLGALSKSDLYITDEGVKITNIASVTYHRDLDKLAEKAEDCHWKKLEYIFGNDMGTNFFVSACRTQLSNFCVVPRLSPPGRPIPPSPEETMIRLLWSKRNSIPAWLIKERLPLDGLDVHRSRRPKERGRKLLPPDDDEDKRQRDDTKVPKSDKPLAVFKSHNLNIHPYSRSASKRLVLAHE